MPDNNQNPDPTGQPYAGYPPTGTIPAQPGAYAAPPQQVIYQQVPVPVPVPVNAPAQPAARADPEGTEPDDDAPHHPQITIVSHSSLFYWWPVWVVGYLMTLFTWSYGESFTIGETAVRIHPSNNVGILFVLTVFLVVLITNIEVRGLAS